MSVLSNAARNNGRRCLCGFPLTFEPYGGSTVSCRCERCERRSAHMSGLVNVYGHGPDDLSAFDDWLARLDMM